MKLLRMNYKLLNTFVVCLLFWLGTVKQFYEKQNKEEENVETRESIINTCLL